MGNFSYLLACLLHDVGHAPFSHTLEKYYGNKMQLAKALANAVGSDEFYNDLQGKEQEANFHEYVSAWVAIRRFAPEISSMGGRPEFVARMIIGLFYQDKDKHQIDNCMISLLHGEVIDADRLDYTCRDVWASGYHTSSYDLKRLISALHIRKKVEDNDYVVCFDSNVVNEIDNVMTVKDFQMKYVFNHHTVIYDQYLLTSAVENTAFNLYGNKFKKVYKEECDIVAASTNELCCIDSMLSPLQVGNMKLINPSDGDFICLMKQDEDNECFKEWYSRRYTRFAIWKTPDEFAGFFQIKRNQSIEHPDFETEVLAALKNYGLAADDVLIKKATYKPKVLLKSLYILVHKELKRFTEIYPDENSTEDIVFYYVYVKKPNDNSEEIEILRKKLIGVLEPVMHQLYSEFDIQKH